MVKQENPASNGVQEKVNGLEKWLDGVYKNVPSLPEPARKWIANNAYWLAAVGGILGLWGAYSLWQVAQWGNGYMQYANELSQLYGTAPVSNYSAVLWVVLIVAVVQAVLLLMAVGGLKAHRKGGWNLLFYGSLLNVAAGILYLFMDRYGVGSLIGSLIGSAIGLYFLFQIRSYFTGKS